MKNKSNIIQKLKKLKNIPEWSLEHKKQFYQMGKELTKYYQELLESEKELEETLRKQKDER